MYVGKYKYSIHGAYGLDFLRFAMSMSLLYHLLGAKMKIIHPKNIHLLFF